VAYGGSQEQGWSADRVLVHSLSRGLVRGQAEKKEDCLSMPNGQKSVVLESHEGFQKVGVDCKSRDSEHNELGPG
jgi:hypothetical protein